MSILGNAATAQRRSARFIPDTMRFTIGGTIWRSVQTGSGTEAIPWPKITVQLGDTAHFAQTDEQGRYRFSNLPPGIYPLVIRALANPPALGKKLADGPTITVPPPAPYDVVI